MRTKEKRLLTNRMFANLPNLSQETRADNGCDTEFANDDAYEKLGRLESVGAQATHTAEFVGENAYSPDEGRDLGGEG